MRTLLAKLLAKLFDRYNPDHPKGALRTIKSGAFYRIMDRENNLYYSTCHTVGDIIWVRNIDDAEIVDSGEARQLMEGFVKFGFMDRLPELVHRADPKHPLHHCIPASTQHYMLHQTKQGEWFARAVVNGIRYETLAWKFRNQAEEDADNGSMYDNVRNAEAHESPGQPAGVREAPFS